jgi:hypothetical protein
MWRWQIGTCCLKVFEAYLFRRISTILLQIKHQSLVPEMEAVLLSEDLFLKLSILTLTGLSSGRISQRKSLSLKENTLTGLHQCQFMSMRKKLA